MVRDYSQFLPGAAETPRRVPRLTALGWGPHFAQQVDTDEMEATPPGRVTRVDRSGLTVALADGSRVLPPDAEVTVGDWLMLDEAGMVRRLDRRSLIQRRAPGRDVQIQLIAANIDTSFIVTSCNKDFNLARLERYLALAFDAGTEPVILLTKPDLCDDPGPYVAEAEAISDQVPVLCINAKGGDVRDRLSAWGRPGRTVAFLGTSGVGKSTLLNALHGAEVAKTGGIREDDARGRHTTTRRELSVVPGDFAVLDTPGMRELQLTDAADGIRDVYADIEELALNCRFSDCAHDREPGCAVREAVEVGRIDAGRLDRWRKLAAEEAHNSADLAERRRRDKAFGKMVNKAVRAKKR
ncbi:ribosome small subunit-dependent GTPase A [Jannaschia sp. M317]|uniref:ribosome small subunit-dependent GTPase A n=1 Tax=Jannaschia sp. M317 TaxID=2867011 RepID=UPI0021A519AF|nr:ribosome small subunit-dependent GTPase A [Jannaschia sp. M317]UWQ17664.1 ribosome small subunit-dependent GTPase A [Jannaschia sp. M317]